MTQAVLFAENTVTGLDVELVSDPHLRGLVVVTPTYFKKHLGQYFHISGKTTLNAGATLQFISVIPAGVHTHVGKLRVKTLDGPLDIYLYEGATVSANGTPITPLNVDRTSETVSQHAVYAGPTVTANGTQILYDLVEAAHKEGGLGGDTFDEFILKDNIIYLFSIINNGLVATTVAYTFEWIEDTTND